MDFEYELSQNNLNYSKSMQKLQKSVNISELLFCLSLPLTIRIILTLCNYPILNKFYFPILVPLFFIIILTATNFISSILKAKKQRIEYLRQSDLLKANAKKANYSFISSDKVNETAISLNKNILIAAIIINVILFLILSASTNFTIKKWNENKFLRPYMVSSFIDLQRKYSLGIDNITVEDEPNFLPLYSREEIISFFDTEEIKYPDNNNKSENGEYIADVFYAFTDYSGLDYWLVIDYGMTPVNPIIQIKTF